MKILFISQSAAGSPYSKGDRVVAKTEKDKWLVGKISANRLGRVYVIFDDGSSKNYAFSTKNILVIPKLKKRVKQGLTEKQARALAEEYGAKAKIEVGNKDAVRTIAKAKLQLALPRTEKAKVLDAVKATAPKVVKSTPLKPVVGAQATFTPTEGSYNPKRGISYDTGAPEFFSKSDYEKLTFLGTFTDTKKVSGADNFSPILGIVQRNLLDFILFGGSNFAFAKLRTDGRPHMYERELAMLAENFGNGKRLTYAQFVAQRLKYAKQQFLEVRKKFESKKSVLDIPKFKVTDKLIGCTAHFNHDPYYHLPSQVVIVAVDPKDNTFAYDSLAGAKWVSFAFVYEITSSDYTLWHTNQI